MKTQISRYNNFFTKNNYSGVYQQQGRMLTDADWNESVDILKQLVREALFDTVASGAPRVGGINIVIDSGGVKIQPGEVVVDGIHAQIMSDAMTPLAFDQQPDLPGYPALDAGIDSIVYADVWERPILSLEEALLLDPGLYGADTCTRSQVLLQVKHADYSTDLEAAIDAPQSSVLNPRVGSADFDLTLRTGGLGTDPCDPCEREIEYEAESGNYLFRLEVHRHTINADNSRELVLKWSSENGAEHYRLYDDELAPIEVPSAFKRGNWIYEFFNPQTERHLGLHHATGFTAALRPLQDSFAIPDAVSNSANPYKAQEMVRRWDGYCEIAFDTNGVPSVTTGTDRGIPPGQFDAQIDADGKLTLQLDTLVLDLQLATVAGSSYTPRNFISGDFWMALVREDSDEKVRVLSPQPLGVVHHYLKLAVIESGSIREPTNAELRRLSFPALTDLSADRVRYDTDRSDVRERWDDISETSGVYPETVQQAIDDLLIGLESDDIRYTMQDCLETDYDTPVASFNSYLLTLIKEELSITDIDFPEVKLKDLWDVLLCKLDASILPYDTTPMSAIWDAYLNDGATRPTNVQDAIDSLISNLESSDIGYKVPTCGNATNPTLRTELNLTANSQVSLDNILTTLLCQTTSAKLPMDKTGDFYISPVLDQLAIRTTQDALNYLADKIAGRGCASTVGPSGDYPTLEAAFDGLAASPSINLCLMPGEHTLDKPITLSGKQAIRLSGSGKSACRISFNQPAVLNAEALSMENIKWQSDDRRASLVLSGTNVDVQHCGFERIRPYNPHLWSTYFGGQVNLSISWAAIDSKDFLLLCGVFNGKAKIGDKEYASQSNQDAFVMKMDPDGKPVWFVPYGSDVNWDQVASLVLDHKDNVWVTGYYSQSITIGDVRLNSVNNSQDVYLAKFGTEGKFISAFSIGGDSTEQAMSLAVDSKNNLWMAGIFYGELIIGEFKLQSFENTQDVFFACFSEDGKPIFASSIEGPGYEYVQSLIVDGEDNIWLGGRFRGTIKIGEEVLVSTKNSSGADTEDAFIAKFKPDGTPITAMAFGGGDGTDNAQSLAVDSKNNLWVTGTFYQTMTVGKTTLTSEYKNQDVFLAKFNADGTPITATSLGGPSYDIVYSMVIDSQDTVWLAGMFSQTITIGKTTLTATGSTQDIYIGRFASDGQALFATTIGGTGYESQPVLASDSNDNIWISGFFQGNLIIGGKTIGDSGVTENGFSVKLSNKGEWLAYARIHSGVSGYVEVNDVSTDGDGNTWLCGQYAGTIMVGSTLLESTRNAGGGLYWDSYIAKYDKLGQAILALGFGGEGTSYASRVAIAPDGNIWFGGYFQNQIAIGDITLKSTGSQDAYLACLSPDGKPLLAISYTSSSYENPQEMAIDSQGNVWVSGYFMGTMKLGEFTLVSTKNSSGGDTYDAFVVKFDSKGNPTAAISFGGVSTDLAQALAVDGQDNVWVAGQFTGTMKIGEFTLTSTKNASGGDSIDAYLLKLDNGAKPIAAISIGGVSTDFAQVITLDSQDNLWMSGYFTQTMKIGKTTLKAVSNGRDIFLAKFNSGAQPITATSFGGATTEYVYGITIDSKDTVWLAGNFNTSITIGDTVLDSLGSDDIFLASFDVLGNPLTATRFGGTAGDTSRMVTLDSGGNIVLVGLTSGVMDLAGDEVGAGLGNSVYLAKLVNPQPDHPLVIVDSKQAGAAMNWINNESMEAVDIDGQRHYLDAMVVGDGIGGQIQGNQLRGSLVIKGQAKPLLQIINILKTDISTVGLVGLKDAILPSKLGLVRAVTDNLRRKPDLSISENVMERIVAPSRRDTVAIFRGNIIQDKGSYINAEMLTFNDNAFPNANEVEVIAHLEATNIMAVGNQAANIKAQIELKAVNPPALGPALLEYL